MIYFRIGYLMRCEELKEYWNSGKPISGSKSIRYGVHAGQSSVIKKLQCSKDLSDHISYYRKVLHRRIRTPKIISVDKKNLMIKYQAIGIEINGDRVWSKTLVNFQYDKAKEQDIIRFLVQSIKYALRRKWTDLHSANILFDKGYLYLIDYVSVPGKGSHKIGTFGIQCVTPNEKINLRKEGFDKLLEKALCRFGTHKVSYKGLEDLRKNDSQI